jgi:Cu2+-exporting ATPase
MREEHEAAWLLIRFGVGAFLAMNIMLFSLLLYSGTFGPSDGALVHAVHILLWILATPVLLVLGEPFLRGAWQAAREGRASADTLVSLGAIAAYGYSVFAVATAADSVYFDTVAMVLVLFTLGRYLEAEGRTRAMRSLAPMLAAERASATVVEDGRDHERSVRAIAPGTIVRVRPGERVPVDGVVIEGRSRCDEAALTGQSDPRPKLPGAAVYAGSVNGTGQLLIRTTAAGTATQWGQAAQYVREALSRRSLVGELVDRAAALFVPAVVLLAAATVLYWSFQGPFDRALMTGLAVLVVACPCALGLAAPIATALGLGRAAQRGILLRGGGVLELLARVKGMAYDKTGTLTTGEMSLAAILPLSASKHAVLRRAAALARGSEHPMARAISKAAHARDIKPLPLGNLQAYPGEGVIGDLDGIRTAMGSAAFMKRLGWPLPSEVEIETFGGRDHRSTVYVGWDGAVRGRLCLDGPPMADARSVVSALGQLGIASCLLSGDAPAATGRAAAAVGIETWYGGLSPMAKVEALRAWARGHGPVAMVGDGLNDGPVLAYAAVGIAVGGATDLARETADIRLPNDGLDSLPWLVGHARRVRLIIITNIAWAVGYNVTALSFAAAGLLQPIVAAGLMAGSSLFVVLNSLLVGREPSSHAADPVGRPLGATVDGGPNMAAPPQSG